MKDCSCGSKGYLQDFGSVFWVKCRGCGKSTQKRATSDLAVMEWDNMNANNKPSVFNVKSGQPFTDLMNRQKAGELYVHSIEFVSNAEYRVQVTYA